MVVGMGSRLCAGVLSLALLIGNVGALCAGWAPTPEARMACCVDGSCPMHKDDSHQSSSGHAVTQQQADSCCAASERQPSSQSSEVPIGAISSAALDVGTLLPASIPSLVLSDAWRTVLPVPSTPVPKHVLLSVFLV